MADICKSCGLPTELCVCEEIAREQQDISIYIQRRRYGKLVTIVEGIDTDIDIENLAKQLKTRCASGGTVKDGNIELQGDHKTKVTKALEDLGYKVKIK